MVNGVCSLVGVTVTGSITVLPSSALTLTGSSVGGNISVQDAVLTSRSSSVRGNINLNTGSAVGYLRVARYRAVSMGPAWG